MTRLWLQAILAGLLCGCTANTQDAYEARRRAADDRVVADAQAFTDRLNAQAEAKIADTKKRIERYTPQLRTYAACNRSASRAVAPQTGDPVSLAIAARNLCRADEADLRKAIYAALDNDLDLAESAFEGARKRVLENNTGDIVAARAGAGQSQRQPDSKRDTNGI